jgi:hypothetical protein
MTVRQLVICISPIEYSTDSTWVPAPPFFVLVEVTSAHAIAAWPDLQKVRSTVQNADIGSFSWYEIIFPQRKGSDAPDITDSP